MQSLTATDEQPLKMPALAFVEITRLANPIAEDLKNNKPLKSRNSLSGKRRRNKKTVPKPKDLEEMDMSVSALHTPPMTPTIIATPEQLRRGISSSHEAQESDSEDPGSQVLADKEDYRRFSSRRRRKTDFFCITKPQENEATTIQPQLAGVKRKRLVRRLLRFDTRPAIKEELPPVEMETGNDSSTPEKVIEQHVSEDVSNQEKEFSDTEESGDTAPEKKPLLTSQDIKEQFPLGMMVWGKLPGYDWWPGNVISYDEGVRGKEGTEREEKGLEPQVWVKWFGENNLSQISGDRLNSFDRFSDYYHPMSMKGMYKKALITALKEASRRCKMEFLSRPDDKKPRWVITETHEPQLIEEANMEEGRDKEKLSEGGADDSGAVKGDSGAVEGDSGTVEGDSGAVKGDSGAVEGDSRAVEGDSGAVKGDGGAVKGDGGAVKGDSGAGKGDSGAGKGDGGAVKGNHGAMKGDGGAVKGNSGAGKGGKGRRGKQGKERGAILLTALEQEMIDWALGGFLPAGPDGLKPSPEQEVQVRVVPVGVSPGEEERGHSEDEPPRKRAKVMLLQIRRKARFDSVVEGRLKISDLCIGCGDMEVMAEHPLFEGGLCKDCKDNFMECAYLFDDDGTQMYCCICSDGEEVFMCDAENCAKVYCGPCIEKLCGTTELERVRAAEQWLCYMCSSDSKVGLLERREDWDRKLQELFINDHEMEYNPPPFYPPIPPEERRPLRVLGLFDGIATGFLVLKELGVEVENYVASEIDPDAIKISRVQHKEIIHVGDISRITEKDVKAWGPFDLVMGGSPCNDLSIVNPARKGIYEGTGRLFFEFFRIMMYAKPAPGEERAFFWLYENVVSMRAYDKQTISRFLQCNPVVVDARNISAANRARYFWGNLPGMNRPTTPLPSDRLTLQECLEPNCFRQAQFTKLRTITTKMNSIKQTKKAIYPVKVEGAGVGEEGDVLWCTEMERLFGFPDHYTDVANLGRCGRQRLLGKAWSVPVIRHLLSPLKDYFQSTTIKETTRD